MNQSLFSPKAHISRPQGQTMVCLLWRFFKQFDSVITTLRCIWKYGNHNRARWCIYCLRSVCLECPCCLDIWQVVRQQCCRCGYLRTLKISKLVASHLCIDGQNIQFASCCWKCLHISCLFHRSLEVASATNEGCGRFRGVSLFKNLRLCIWILMCKDREENRCLFYPSREKTLH